MHYTISDHNPLTDTHPIPKEGLAHSWVTPHTLYSGMIFYSKELLTSLAPSKTPSFLCTSSEHGILQSPLFRVSTTEHQCVTNVILILSPEHSTDQLEEI